MALDEIGECDPRVVDEIVYALANGIGKQRANRAGGERPVTRWRCITLSSGERTLETIMAEAGIKTKAGQLVRCLNIPARREYGTWDDLHGFKDGAPLSDAVVAAAETHYVPCRTGVLGEADARQARLAGSL